MIANPLKDYGISDRISVIMVERIKKRALRGAVRLLYLFRIVLVALSCLLIGFSARHLLDAYGPKMIPFLKKEILRTLEAQMEATPHQDVSSRVDPVEPRWN
jgi:hypothetical protein